MTRKTISKKINSKGVTFALVSDGVTWEVWKLCENYAGHCKGGIARQWRYVKKNMDKLVAESLFISKVAA